jgi:hypothetical protein
MTDKDTTPKNAEVKETVNPDQTSETHGPECECDEEILYFVTPTPKLKFKKIRVHRPSYQTKSRKTAHS